MFTQSGIHDDMSRIAIPVDPSCPFDGKGTDGQGAEVADASHDEHRIAVKVVVSCVILIDEEYQEQRQETTHNGEGVEDFGFGVVGGFAVVVISIAEAFPYPQCGVQLE